MYGYIEHVVGSAERDISRTERVETDEQLGALAASICRSVGILRNLLRFRSGADARSSHCRRLSRRYCRNEPLPASRVAMTVKGWLVEAASAGSSVDSRIGRALEALYGRR